jgi:hypothetical protein
VRVVTSLLGYLHRAMKGASGTDPADTKVEVPGSFIPTLSLPFPFFTFTATPLGGGVGVPVNSWMFQRSQTFAANGTQFIAIIGPGLWRLDYDVHIEERGAVSDPTSTYALNLIEQEGSGVTLTLARISNKQGVHQSYQGSLSLLVSPSTQNPGFQIAETTVIGLGTGVNLAHTRITATRLF